MCFHSRRLWKTQSYLWDFCGLLMVTHRLTWRQLAAAEGLRSDQSLPDRSLTPAGSMRCNHCLSPNISRLLSSFKSSRPLIPCLLSESTLSKLQPLESWQLAARALKTNQIIELLRSIEMYQRAALDFLPTLKQRDLWPYEVVKKQHVLCPWRNSGTHKLSVIV